MSDGAQPQKRQDLAQRAREVYAKYPDAVAIGVYAVVSILALIVAYFWIFTEFAGYDDEGTLLVGLQAYTHGQALYNDVWSVYGPFYYELFGAFFSLTGWAITTDASRSIVIVIWVATSLMFGLAAHRLSGRLALGVAAMITAFSVLNVLANEPMHPQELCVLLFAAFALIASSGPGRRIAWIGAGCGALLAALILTKVNLGVFGIAATVLTVALTVEPFQRRRWIRWPVIAGFLVLPTFILARDLDLSWVRELIVIEALAALALIVTAWGLRPRPDEGDGGLTRWAVAAAIGFAVAFATILAVIVITGSSLHDVYEGVVTQAFRIRKVTFSQFPFPAGSAIDWAVLALGGAVLVARLRSIYGERPSLWSGLLRGLVGLVIWLTVAHVTPIAFNPSAANPEIVPMLLAWVALIPPAGAPEEAPYKRFLRVLLVAFAVAETLQVYPTPGSQLGIAAVSFVPVGAICLADAVVEARAWSAARGANAVASLATFVVVASAALAGMLALDVIFLPGATSAVTYANQPKLALPGAELMRLGNPQNEQYSEIVSLLESNHCSTFVGYPSINSFYLWSGLEAPPPQLPNAWVYMLDEGQQRRAVAGFRASPRPCAIRNEELAAPYLHGEPTPNTALIRYLDNNFRPLAKVGEFEFMLPKPSATGG